MKRIFKIIGKVLLIVILLFVALIGKTAFATSLEESILVTGTQNLVDSIISWLTGINGSKYLVDSNSKFEKSNRSKAVLVTTGRGGSELYLQPIEESMEEIQKLINNAEAETTNAKLDLILANQEKILKALRIQ